MPTKIISFGYKHRKPSISDIDLEIDVRKFMELNPHRLKDLKNLKGDDPRVIQYLNATPDLEVNYIYILELVDMCRGIVYIGCTGGKHRSVYIANRLGKDLNVEVEHLDYDS